MNTARVAFHATSTEAAEWSAAQGDRPEPRHSEEDLRAGWRASLEALGYVVEE